LGIVTFLDTLILQYLHTREWRKEWIASPPSRPTVGNAPQHLEDRWEWHERYASTVTPVVCRWISPDRNKIGAVV
jgi:hypothetical protein